MQHQQIVLKLCPANNGLVSSMELQKTKLKFLESKNEIVETTERSKRLRLRIRNRKCNFKNRIQKNVHTKDLNGKIRVQRQYHNQRLLLKHPKFISNLNEARTF